MKSPVPERRVAGDAIAAWLLAVVSLAIALGVQLDRLRHLAAKFFDPDEFQHLHSAWRISLGELPFRDYFEHHVPLYHLHLAPVFRFFRVDESYEEALSLLLLARKESWLLSGAVLVLVFLVGKAWRGPVVGLLAVSLLAPARSFVVKSLEARPDVLALVLLLGATWALLEGVLRSGPGTRRATLLVGLAGLLLGAGLVTSQKVVFSLPGFGAALLVATRGRDRIRRAALLAAAAAVPIAAVAVFLAARGAFGAFVTDVFVWNLRWKERFPPTRFLPTLAEESGALLALGALGLLASLGAPLLPGRRRDGLAVPLLALSVVAGLFLNPVPWLQSFLPLFPFLALGAASLLSDLASLLPPRPLVRAAVLAGALAALSVGPVRRLPTVSAEGNAEQLASLRWVLENSRPTDTYLDTWSGQGVFRPHAWRYYFLHYELRKMLTEEDHRKLLADLESGRIRPELVTFDFDLRELSPGIRAFFERSYAPAAPREIWRRKSP